MHMADALLSPAVGTTMYAMSAVAAGVSVRQLVKSNNNIGEQSSDRIPKMAVMSALVFAGQMVNFTIPGTGSSGHLCGGMMLAAVLGPYDAFLSMIVVLLTQCLFFADGGIMALGANIWNMAFYGCFVGYFIIYGPIMRSGIARNNSDEKKKARIKIILASVAGCMITLQLGAFSVVVETILSGVTSLTFGSFVLLMQPIHLAIGLVEGIITAAVLIFVYENRPQLVRELPNSQVKEEGSRSYRTVIILLAVITLVVGGGVSLAASSNPDGLEWALEKSEFEEPEEEESGGSALAFLPDYAFKNNPDSMAGTSVSGVVGSAMVALMAAGVCFVGHISRKKINE